MAEQTRTNESNFSSADSDGLDESETSQPEVSVRITSFTSSSRGTSAVESNANNTSLVTIIGQLTKLTLMQKPSNLQRNNQTTTTSSYIIASLIILASIFLGPTFIRSEINFPLATSLACTSVGVFLGLNCLLVLDMFKNIKKYIVADIAILISLFSAPFFYFYISYEITLSLNLIAFAEFLFLLLVLSGPEIKIKKQFVYLTILLLLCFLSSLSLLSFVNLNNNRFIKNLSIVFIAVYGTILFIVGLRKIHIPSVCIIFIWFGCHLITNLQFVVHDDNFGVIFLYLLSFFVGLMLPIENIAVDMEESSQSLLKRWWVNIWEFHKRIVSIRTVEH